MMEVLNQCGILIWQFIKEYMGSVLFSAVFFAIAFFLLRMFVNMIKKGMQKLNIDQMVIRIILIVLKSAVYFIIAIVILNAFHISVTSFVALFSALGLALSLVLKDTLSNFAEGLLLMIVRPFKIGDYIKVDNISGTVKAIEIIYTKLATPDGKLILIPNRDLASAKIINFSSNSKRRLDIIIFISENQKIDLAKEMILQTVLENELVEAEPKPVLFVSDFSENAWQFTLQVWGKSENFDSLSKILREEIFAVLQKNQVSLPMKKLSVSVTSTES